MVAFVPPILAGLSALSRVGPAAVRGYRTFKKARQVGGLGTSKAAQAGTGSPIGYQGTLAQKIIGQQKGLGSGTGLQGLSAKFSKKFPTGSGGLEAGFGVSAGGQGVSDFVTGYQQGDVPQMLTGLGSLGLGATFLGRGSRILGMSKKLPAGVRQAVGATGKEATRRMGKAVPIGSLAALGTGVVGQAAGFGTPDSPPEDPKVLGDPIEAVKIAIQEDIENPNVDTNTSEYKKQATDMLTQAYQIAENQGLEIEQSLTELTSPYIIKSEAPGSNSKMPNDAALNAKGLSDEEQMSDVEIAAVAKKQEQEAKAGEKIKDNVLTKASQQEAEQFNQFYDRLMNLTGGNDQTNNLILMKLASGLVTGKTGQSGFRGFLDVLGQSTNETVDTALALYTKEADRRNTLAAQFLKSKEKNKYGRAVTGNRKKISVAVDKSVSPFGVQTRTVDYFKDDGTTAMFAPVYAEDGQTVIAEQAIPMPYGEDQTPIKTSPAQLGKLLTQLDNVGLAYQMTQQVLAMPDSAYGFGPRVKMFSEDALGSLESLGEAFGMNIGSFDPGTDAKVVQDIISAPLFGADGEVRALTEEEADEQRKIVQQYKKEIDGILSDFRPGEEELDNITRAKLIQTRLKYIVANANKAEDRLTQKDIENAEESTKIIGFKSPRAVRSAYEQLQGQLNTQFEGVGRRFIRSGGTNKYILEHFQHMPLIADWISQKQTQAAKDKVQQNNISVLEGIQM